MNRDKNVWLSGVIALAATLLILFGSQTIWHTFAVAKPLDKAFAGIDGVQAVARNTDDKTVELRVTLAHTANIQNTYKTLQERAKSVLGKSPFRITLHDNRTPELEKVYHEIHFHIQEAIATGRFGDMASQINEKAQAAGANVSVYVDAQSIYLQLSKGDSELYSVIPRSLTEVK